MTYNFFVPKHITRTTCSGITLSLSLVSTHKIRVQCHKTYNIYGPFSLSLWGKNICTHTLNTGNSFGRLSLFLYDVQFSCAEPQSWQFVQAFICVLWRKNMCTLKPNTHTHTQYIRAFESPSFSLQRKFSCVEREYWRYNRAFLSTVMTQIICTYPIKTKYIRFYLSLFSLRCKKFIYSTSKMKIYPGGLSLVMT